MNEMHENQAPPLPWHATLRHKYHHFWYQTLRPVRRLVRRPFCDHKNQFRYFSDRDDFLRCDGCGAITGRFARHWPDDETIPR